ncbi:histidine kinase [Flavobacterium akiainvivens]|uniref:Histidine kinase n=1 Tax=Flavobacterium akiainvivens TaxID=1202724 RepID=A0A0M8MDS5_9FLAO|nr:2TM domain-containing protein [Flavobacterium akiainvivens]KOS08115.1 histidine kinase [Flavobacterium akiainvivens]SFQ72032.1 2TM domain-containing protein [Flavobacterium akiainvivens]
MEAYNEFDTESVAYKKAKDKIKEIKGFYYNLACFCIVIPVLIYINLRYLPEFHWFWFSIAGWGTGVIIQGMFAFGWVPFLGKDWETRKINQIMEQGRKREEQEQHFKN